MKRLTVLCGIMILTSTAHAHDAAHVPVDPVAVLAYTNEAVITVDSHFRYIRSNGIPDHLTGRFPNRGNPNTIAPQNHRYRVSLNPVQASRTTRLDLGVFGVALNGVPFNPGAAEFWHGDRNWQYEALSGKIDLGLDANHAHVQPRGEYHYHGIPTLMIANDDPATHSKLIGYAADGFPIYARYGLADTTSVIRVMKSSYRLKKGARTGGPGGTPDGTFVQDYEFVLGAGDLDECNGRFGVTPDYPAGIYHYFLTDDFPFVPRQFRGTPDPSFLGPPGIPGRGRRRGRE